ncbi:MAG: hypothetical protein IT370_08130 [Deltaproteobacteria bacterium]|nr:hypothetical protein [Deltaproteobacteria bacterium]
MKRLKSGGLLVALLTLGCGDKPRKLDNADLARLEVISKQLPNSKPSSLVELLLPMLSTTPGLFSRACAKRLDGYASITRDERTQAAAAVVEACHVPEAGPDTLFSAEQRQLMSAPDYQVTRFALERTRTALAAEGSPRAQQIWGVFESQLPAIAASLARAAPVVAAPPPPPRSPIQFEVVSTDETPVDPSLPQRIRDVYLDDITECLRDPGENGPSPTGRAQLSFTVMPLGPVNWRNVTSTGSGRWLIDSCLNTAVSTWRFAKTIDGEPHPVLVNITFPAAP